MAKTTHKHEWITDQYGDNEHCKICGKLKNKKGTYHKPSTWRGW